MSPAKTDAYADDDDDADDGQDFDEDEVEDDAETPTVHDIYFSLPEAERLPFLAQQVRELEAVDEPGEDADEDDDHDVDEGQDFDEDEDEEEADAEEDDLSAYLASLPEEEQFPELKRIVREQAATIALQGQHLEERVDEDEEGYWYQGADEYWYWHWYSLCDDQDGGADDDDDDDAPTDPDLSTPPDADADPTEAIDADAEI
jgi:hypothetical protein